MWCLKRMSTGDIPLSQRLLLVSNLKCTQEFNHMAPGIRGPHQNEARSAQTAGRKSRSFLEVLVKADERTKERVSVK
jgi:hypothetical protein